MADVSIKEIWDKEEMTLVRGNFFHDESTCTKTFVVEGVDTEAEACSLAYYAADRYLPTPDGKLSIPRYSASVQEKCGNSQWKIAVEYKYVTNSMYDELGDSDDSSHVYGDGSRNSNHATHSFDCVTATMHVFNPLAQTCRYSETGLVVGGQYPGIPIGATVNPEDEPSGADILFPQVTEKYTKTFPIDVVLSIGWKRKMMAFSRCVNLGQYHGYETGEVLFLGCTYNTPLVGANRVSVDFNYSVIPNDQNAVVGGHPIGSVYGHDFVWAMYKPGVGNLKQVANVFVSRVYNFVNLNLLGV